MLKIYNSLTRKKQSFTPIKPGNVRMYVCGMTVYDYCHLGHARVMVVFDMISRYLCHLDYIVTYVRNITDIDDKIIRRAQENSQSITDLTTKFIDAMHEDAAALGVLPPSLEPKASDHIQTIIDMISRLIDNGFAYLADNQDVYYSVHAYPDYGQLSGKQIDELQAGARVQVQTAKQDPLDFVLWKSAKPGEPYWDSPWGAGRPGWHIECSAMSTHCLGGHFDIHGGGQDLQFPHHENEIAQSIGATGKPFVNIWMHNGFVRVAEEKMSKSTGNFFTVREVMAKYPAEVIRFFILSSHYRSPLNYSTDNLDTAQLTLTNLYTALRDITPLSTAQRTHHHAAFFSAMDDDFNTPKAIAVLHDIAHDINRLADKQSCAARELATTLRELAGIIGLLQADPQAFLQAEQQHASNTLTDAQIEAHIAARDKAREAKDFAEADRLRDVLAAYGIYLEDTPTKTIWRRR